MFDWKNSTEFWAIVILALLCLISLAWLYNQIRKINETVTATGQNRNQLENKIKELATITQQTVEQSSKLDNTLTEWISSTGERFKDLEFDTTELLENQSEEIHELEDRLGMLSHSLQKGGVIDDLPPLYSPGPEKTLPRSYFSQRSPPKARNSGGRGESARASRFDRGLQKTLQTQREAVGQEEDEMSQLNNRLRNRRSRTRAVR